MTFDKTEQAADDIAYGLMELLTWANESGNGDRMDQGAQRLSYGLRTALELLKESGR